MLLLNNSRWRGFAIRVIKTKNFTTISGGSGAALSGGNFWQGAATGRVVSGLNHALHHGYNYKSDGKKKDPPKYKYKGKIYEDKVKLYGAILIDQAADQYRFGIG